MHGEGTVFCLLHYFAFAGSFVVDAAQMEYAVYDDAAQFVVILLAELLGIGAYGVETDNQVAVNAVALVVVESDDVSIVMMIEGPDVDVENVRVGTENYIDLTDAAVLSLGDGLDPSVREPPDIEFETCIFK